MAAKMFINYRREDTEAIAHRIYDKLCDQFGSEAVFIDGKIPLGTDFRQHIVRQISESSVVLAVLGPDWLKRVHERENDPEDWLRVEIETALQQKIPVIPVRIGETPMPPAKDLPQSILAIAFKNATQISPGAGFHADMDRLIQSLIADHHFQAVKGGDKRIEIWLAKWDAIKGSENPADFRKFLAEEPPEDFAGLAVPALEKLEEIEWDRVGANPSISAFEDYLAKYPKGSHAAKASDRLAALQRHSEEAAVRRYQTETSPAADMPNSTDAGEICSSDRPDGVLCAQGPWVRKGPFWAKEQLIEEAGKHTLKLDVRIEPGKEAWQRIEIGEATDDEGLPVVFWPENYNPIYLSYRTSLPRGCFVWHSTLIPDAHPQFVNVVTSRSGLFNYESSKLCDWVGKAILAIAVICFYFILYTLFFVVDHPTQPSLRDFESCKFFVLPMLPLIVLHSYLSYRDDRAKKADEAASEALIWSGNARMIIDQWPWPVLEGFSVKQTYGSGVSASFGLKFEEFWIRQNGWPDSDNNLSRLLTLRFIVERSEHFQRLGLDRSGLPL